MVLHLNAAQLDTFDDITGQQQVSNYKRDGQNDLRQVTVQDIVLFP